MSQIVRRGFACVLAMLLLAFFLGAVVGPSAAAVPPSGGHGFDGSADDKDNRFLVEAQRLRDATKRTTHSPAKTETDASVVKFVRSAGCRRVMGAVYTPGCADPLVVDMPCLDGTQALEPLFVRTENGDGSWGRWEMVSYYTCPQDEVLVAAIEHEWSTLTPTPSTATIQPAGGWVYANVPTIAMADDGPQVRTMTVLGAQVDIRATPATFTWVWGDGEHTVTQDPGAPYPDETLTHTYAHMEGEVTVALETTWSGQYRINTGTWAAFGTAERLGDN